MIGIVFKDIDYNQTLRIRYSSSSCAAAHRRTKVHYNIDMVNSAAKLRHTKVCCSTWSSEWLLHDQGIRMSAAVLCHTNLLNSSTCAHDVYCRTWSTPSLGHTKVSCSIWAYLGFLRNLGIKRFPALPGHT